LRDKYRQAIKLIDEENIQDPNVESFEGREYPKELLYSMRMTEWLNRLEPNSSEPLRLAARAQHVRRWEIPRNSYSAGRDGYKKWRRFLFGFHSDKASEILRKVGYDENTISRVRSLIKKENFKTDPESQLLEDVVCLVFLKYYFDDFAIEHEEEKLIRIVKQTWKKMSPSGHKAALELRLSESASNLIEKALK